MIFLSAFFSSKYDNKFIMAALSNIDKDKISYQSLLPDNSETFKSVSLFRFFKEMDTSSEYIFSLFPFRYPSIHTNFLTGAKIIIFQNLKKNKKTLKL